MNTNQVQTEEQIKNILKEFFQANSYPVGCLVELAGSTRPRIVSKVINKMNTEGEPCFMYQLDDTVPQYEHQCLKFIDVPRKQYCSMLLNDEEFDDHE